MQYSLGGPGESVDASCKSGIIVFSAVLKLPVVAVLMQGSGEVQMWKGLMKVQPEAHLAILKKALSAKKKKKSSHRPLEFLRFGRNVGFNTSFYPLLIHKAAVTPTKLTPHQQVRKINSFSSSFMKCLDCFVINDIEEATRK